MKVVILGSGGMLGSDLVALAPPGITISAFTHAQLDVTNDGSVEHVLAESRPDILVNATAYTQVDRAESEPDLAFAVNARAVGDLAAQCEARGILLVHFSTDYVFDGASARPYREDDPVNPTSVYGASKRAGEDVLRASGAHHLLLRTSWLFGEHGRSFPRTMWDRALAQKPTRVVNDQLGRPTYTKDFARAVWAAIAAGLTGTYHAANEGEASWFDVALRIFSAFGAASCLEPCRTAQYPTPTRRPAYSVLDTGKLQRMGIVLPAWTDALDRFIGLLRQQA
jgi:dTDP-4-dehydrorhamnose reductase